MAATKGRQQPSVATQNGRSIMPAGQNAGTIYIRCRHGPIFPLAPLASAALLFQQTAPLEQHPIGAASHGWRECGSFSRPDVSIPGVSIPDISKSAAISKCPFGAAGVDRSKNSSLPAPARCAGRFLPWACVPAARWRSSASAWRRVKALPNGKSSAPPYRRRAAGAPTTAANSAQIFISIVPSLVLPLRSKRETA
jgi:hypothetical protein